MPEAVYWSAVNLSEGRNLEALESLAARCRQSPGAALQDWSADSDHNRAVLSFVGNEAALAYSYSILFDWAQQYLDMGLHCGVHPRIGAVDVVPLCPLKAAWMSSAAAASRRCAQRIAEEFGLPVFCYRESSRDPGRPLTLPLLRRGGSAALVQAMDSGELSPDFGPAVLHPRLGASVFGARPPLVAFNCLLATDDLQLGQAIAREVREVNGGPAGLQALAFALPVRGGQVQLSMNLVRPGATDVESAYWAVARSAEAVGVQTVECEVVGLLPAAHLPGLRRLPVPCPSFQERQLLAIELGGFETHP